MWVPESARDIEARVSDRSLDENAYFDAKRELGSKNKDLAKDVAATANNGGVLIYGIDEDEHKRPTKLAPVILHGQRERVDAVVRMSIAPPPDIQIHEHPLEADPGRGYLVLVVPASPNAPHMVTAEKDNRYYQRLETQSVPMTEGEVARLYERRRRWDVDREQLLQEAIACNHSIWLPAAELADLHIMVRPVGVPNATLLEDAIGNGDAEHLLLNLIVGARAAWRGPSYRPDLEPNWVMPRDSGWRIGSSPEETSHMQIVDLTISDDGRGYLFCGRAGGHITSDQRFVIIEDLIAGLTTRTLSILGGVYDAAKYFGPVDVGVAVTGLSGKSVYSLALINRGDIFLSQMVVPPLPRSEDYRRTERVTTASALGADPRQIARSLVARLIAQVTNGAYDPFGGRNAS